MALHLRVTRALANPVRDVRIPAAYLEQKMDNTQQAAAKMLHKACYRGKNRLLCRAYASIGCFYGLG